MIMSHSAWEHWDDGEDGEEWGQDFHNTHDAVCTMCMSTSAIAPQRMYRRDLCHRQDRHRHRGLLCSSQSMCGIVTLSVFLGAGHQHWRAMHHRQRRRTVHRRTQRRIFRLRQQHHQKCSPPSPNQLVQGHDKGMH